MAEQGSFERYLLQKGHATSSVSSYLKTLERFSLWADQNHIEKEFITYQELLKYLEHLRKINCTQHTIKGYFGVLKHYFNYLIDIKAIESNPVRYLNIKSNNQRTLHHILTREQLDKLYTDFDVRGERLTKASALASAHRNKLATGLMVHQGLNVTALEALKTSDINLDDGTVKVALCRSHNERILALKSPQIMELYRYLEQTRNELLEHFPQNTDALLVHGYTHYTHANRRHIQRLRRQEPLVTSIQQIRASVITHWLKAFNLREVQYMAGHKRVMSTEAYLRNDVEGLQSDIDKFHPQALPDLLQ